MDIKKLRNEHPIDFKLEAKPLNEKTVVYLYGDIVDEIPVDFWTGEQLEGDFITPKGVRDLFDTIESNDIDVHINSYGGSAFAGIAIKNYLQGLNKNLNFYIDAIGASAGSIIPMAGKVKMYKSSMLMVHRAWSYAIGNCNDLLKQAEILEKLDKSLMTNYQDKFKGDNLEELLDKETWLTAQEAFELGLCDEIVDIPKEEVKEEEQKFNKTPNQLEALMKASFNFIKNKGDVR